MNTKSILENVKAQGYEAQAINVVKNGNELNAICVKVGNNIAASVYIDQYEGLPESEIAQNVIKAAESARPDGDFELDRLKDKGYILSNLTAKLIRAEAADRENDIAIPFAGNLAVIPLIKVSNNGVAGTVRLSEKLAEIAGISIGEIEETLQGNLEKESNFLNFAKIYEERMRMIFGNEEFEMPMAPMDILTNKNYVNGAAVLYSDNVRKEIAKDGPKVILPSSIHEVIVLPAGDSLSPEALLDMVKEVNATQVSPEEYLTDAVYLMDSQGVIAPLCVAKENMA